MMAGNFGSSSGRREDPPEFLSSARPQVVTIASEISKVIVRVVVWSQQHMQKLFQTKKDRVVYMHVESR
jgi:hypothetical protein